LSTSASTARLIGSGRSGLDGEGWGAPGSRKAQPLPPPCPGAEPSAVLTTSTYPRPVAAPADGLARHAVTEPARRPVRRHSGQACPVPRLQNRASAVAYPQAGKGFVCRRPKVRDREVGGSNPLAPTCRTLEPRCDLNRMSQRG